jgi:hypothetical protein
MNNDRILNHPFFGELNIHPSFKSHFEVKQYLDSAVILKKLTNYVRTGDRIAKTMDFATKLMELFCFSLDLTKQDNIPTAKSLNVSKFTISSNGELASKQIPDPDKFANVQGIVQGNGTRPLGKPTNNFLSNI